MKKIMKKIIIFSLFIVSFFLFSWLSSDNIEARSHLSKIYYSGYGGFGGEDSNFSVRAGIDDIANLCGKIVEVNSNNLNDIITPIDNIIDCNTGRASFKINPEKAGISTLTAKVEDKVIATCNITFFPKRPNNTLISPIGHPDVFLLKNDYKYRIKNPFIFCIHGFQWYNIIDVSQREELMYSLGEQKLESIMQIEKKYYYVIDDQKLLITEDLSNNDNFFKSIRKTDFSSLCEFDFSKLKRMYLVSYDADDVRGKVYYISPNGFKKHVPNIAIFKSYGNKWSDVVEIPITVSSIYPESFLIRLSGDYKVYFIENQNKHWIKTAEYFDQAGYNWNAVIDVNEVEFNYYLEGGIIE